MSGTFSALLIVSFLLNDVSAEWVQISKSTKQINAKDLNNLKYEDLQTLVGPGFESEFERFLIKNEEIEKFPSVDLPLKEKAKIDFEISSVENCELDIQNVFGGRTNFCKKLANETVFSTANSFRETPKPKPKNETFRAKPENAGKPSKGSFFNFGKIKSFIQRIQKSLTISATAGIDEKIKLLENLKDQMFQSIEHRLSLLWPSRNQRTKSRRSVFEGGGHGMSFPSAEMALMTISFLTFAVYLIKLVLVS